MNPGGRDRLPGHPDSFRVIWRAEVVYLKSKVPERHRLTALPPHWQTLSILLRIDIMMRKAEFTHSTFNDSCEQLAQVHGKPVSGLDATLWELFSRTASSHPRREAIVSTWQPSIAPFSKPGGHGACIRWTYQELFDRATCLASSMSKLGCRPGMRVAAVLWNSAEWGLFWWVAAKLGLTFAPIDPRMPEEASEMLSILRPDVVIAQSGKEAELLDNIDEAKSVAAIYIQCSDKMVPGWSRLCDLWLVKEAQASAPRGDFSSFDVYGSRVPSKHVALIVFTSGTTGKPKGCPHSNRNLISQTCDYDPNPDPALADRWLIHTPVSHIFAINNALRAWRYGGTAIFPSKSFDIESTANAIVHEKCTIMSATPTLVKAILASPSRAAKQHNNLQVVSIAATRITAEDIRLCEEELGAKDAIQAYGMSEGAPLISWSRSDDVLTRSSASGVGKILPGVSARVCEPGSRDVVNINTVGELHVGGSSVISGYLDGGSRDDFYDDGCGRWFRTGDQAVVDELGVVRILGRYKDLIIRGGENLDPSKIEDELNAVEGVQAWVVGRNDRLAGEVPVAVVQMPDTVSKALLSQRAAQMGPKYALGAVLQLKDLGFECVPTTSLGKVKKAKLREAVEGLQEPSLRPPLRLITRPDRELSSLTSVNGTVGSAALRISPSSRPQITRVAVPGAGLVPQLMAVWEELTGCRPLPTTSMSHMADSITLLRYCDAIFRSCGRRLYLQDVVEHDTIEQQARLMHARDPNPLDQGFTSSGVAAPESAVDIEWTPPPNYAELGAGSSVPMGPTKKRADGPRSVRTGPLWKEAQSRIDDLDLRRSLIEDVVPIRAALHRMVRGQRPQSYVLRTTFRVKDASARQVRRGLEKALLGRSMLRSVLLRPNSGGVYHIVLSPSHELFERLISEVKVATEDEARACWQNELPEADLSLMFDARMITVQETRSQYLSMVHNHSVIDALSLWPWHKDLDLMIGDINAPTWRPTPYKLFADLFTQYRSSVPAQEAVSFHVERLRGVSRLKKALWPRQKAPGWMIASDQESNLAQARDEVRHSVWNGEWEKRASDFRLPRLARIVCLPQLRKLKEKGIEQSLFAKSAVVLFNVLTTEATHALFNTWESGRSWPFVPPWMESMLPPAMSIDGPTVQWMLNMVETKKGETLFDFMQRMSEEAKDMRQFEHAPWDKVVKGLRDEGNVAIDASFRQSFVWDVSLGLSVQQRAQGGKGVFSCLEPVERMDWADCGLFWNAFMIDRDNLYFVASWDTAQMNDIEVEGHCDRMADVMRRLGDEKNWDKTVGDVFMKNVAGHGRS